MNSTRSSCHFRVCFWNSSLYFARRFVWLLYGIVLEKEDSLKDIPHFFLMDLPLSLTWVMEARSTNSVVVTLCYKSTIFIQPNCHYFRPFDLKRALLFPQNSCKSAKTVGMSHGEQRPRSRGTHRACGPDLAWSWPWAHVSQRHHLDWEPHPAFGAEGCSTVDTV